MSGTSLGSPNLSWALVVILTPPGMSITSSHSIRQSHPQGA